MTTRPMTTGPMTTGPAPPRGRATVAAAGRLAVPAAGTLAGGTVLLLADALGGVVKVPGDVVTYMALTGLLLACAGLPPVLWQARRMPAHGATAVAGALACLAIALAGSVPAVPVFATGVMLAGLLAAPLLAVPRAQAVRAPGAPAWCQAAALAGAAVAAWLATAHSAEPGTALLFAGLPAALLALASIAVPYTVPAPPARPVARLRDVAGGDVRAALPAYLAAGWVVGASLMGGLHLLLFRWNLVGEQPVRHLAWALPPAVVLVVLGRRTAEAARTLPWLLLAGAAAPVLMATAPGPVLLAAGFTVAAAAACLAVAALDTAVLRPLPYERHLPAAGLTAVAAVAGGLAGYGCVTALRGMLAEGSALTLTAVPPILAALAALRVRGREARRPPPFLEVRALVVPRGPVRLRRIHLRVEAGEIVALTGPGARVLLAALAGRVPSRGKVLLGGADLASPAARRRTGRGLCHLAGPDPGVPDALPIAEGLAGRARAMGAVRPEDAARSVLEVFPALRGRGADLAGTLDAPERSLLSLAEALLARPGLLLVDGIADGPCAGAAHAVLRRLAATGTAVVLAGPAGPGTRALASRVCAVGHDRVTELPDPAPAEARRPSPAASSTGGPAL
ncbi:hypothetical protein [Actinomadura rugatobispora]|uniref:ABC transporter domain-containing protein n=1 Tax=Actinomadura rugatobispora TaxID=1994 RepID=A0ABW1A6Y2_9ACTN|nr:hypothetical protein GCM10010200_020990 [Actinomadura rugatobispora]